MLNKKLEWKVIISTIERLYKDELNYPIDESAYILFDELFFNPRKPLPEEVKKFIVSCFNSIYKK